MGPKNPHYQDGQFQPHDDLGPEPELPDDDLQAMAAALDAALPALVTQAMADKSRGPKNSKLARLLATEVARRHHLLIQA